VWTFICSIVVRLIHYGRYLKLVWVTLGLAYMRRVFSLRIYVADSRRDSVSMYFGKWGVTYSVYVYICFMLVDVSLDYSFQFHINPIKIVLSQE